MLETTLWIALAVAVGLLVLAVLTVLSLVARVQWARRRARFSRLPDFAQADTREVPPVGDKPAE